MKRLIICCDGTWQELDSKYPTNVIKIAQAIQPVGDDNIHQLVYYSEGIGTRGLVDKLGGGAFGWGIDKDILDAYRFLCFNYQASDQIYLFGFSRGAYTVRSLAGLIYNVGLLKPQYIRKTPDAYDLYRQRSQETSPSSPSAKILRQQYSQEVDITLLGCWDTVGSLGIPDQIPFFPLDDISNKKYRFHDTQINRRIQSARHAVAIDEKRKVFFVTPMHKSEGTDKQDLKQIWFPGTHGCVGGGAKENRQLSDSALKWMMDEAQKQGLSFQVNAIEDGIKVDPLISFQDPAEGFFSGLGIKFRKLSSDPKYADLEQNQDPENIEYVYATFSDLHESTIERCCSTSTYRPKGLAEFHQRLDALCQS